MTLEQTINEAVDKKVEQLGLVKNGKFTCKNKVNDRLHQILWEEVPALIHNPNQSDSYKLGVRIPQMFIELETLAK